ncbi:MAG: hypothetical protein KC609_07595 [Myxococcales bacterium]|nr:hypothetical protein [Myxococcales bacterium]
MAKRGWLERTVGDYLPRGLALGDREQLRFLTGARDPVRYLDTPRSALPLWLPFQLFALDYAEDIVLETSHPAWSMHELARVEYGEESFWIAKDSDANGVQTVTADLEAIESWLPEIAVPRRRDELRVDDRSSDTRLELSFRYRNALGEAVAVDFSSPRPRRLERWRNGSTFDHSQQAVSAVIDISRKQMTGIRGDVSYDGRCYPLRRVLGLVPVRALLHQTQIGFVRASARISPCTTDDGGDALRIERPIDGESWPTRGRQEALLSVDGRRTTLSWSSGPTSYAYEFVDAELWRVRAFCVPPMGAAPSAELRLSAPLPDLRRPFDGVVSRRFLLFVNGLCHGYGRMSAKASDDGAELAITPIAPRWFQARPMQSRLTVRGDRLELRCERTPC